MNNFKLSLSLLLTLLSLNSFAATSAQATLENANTLYQNGDCEKAIPAFQAIPESSLDQTQKDTVLFKTSYCHFSLAHYQDSENGFKNYLNLHPDEDEAKLKYAQSLLYQGKNKPAEEAASKIKSGNFKADASIVIARAQIETENFRKAIMTLKPYANNAEALYWAAVACYKEDYDAEAEQRFNWAIQKSNPESWIQTESKAWLNRINQEKRRFHARLTLGVFKDSNIDQSGGSGTINPGSESGGPGGPGGGAGGPGGQGTAGAPGTTQPVFSSANYTSDTGKYAAVDFIHTTYNSRKLTLTTTASLSSSFYADHEAYNQQLIGLDLNLRATPSPTFNYGASLKYQDTFYNKVYSQDYMYLTPSVSWSFAPDYWLKLSIPYTAYLNNKKIKSYGGNVDLYYDPTSWLSVYIGGGSTKSTGPEAVVVKSGQEDKLISGTMFSHYTSTGLYVGLTFYVADSWQFGVSGSKYKTKYELEKIPAGGPPKYPREDKLTALQMSVNKSLIQNVLSANLSHSRTDNKSEGFSGLASSGSVANNTYKRNYTMLTLEYYY